MKYPLTVPKRLLLLVIILFVGDLYNIDFAGITILHNFLIILTALSLILLYGYEIRIIKTSLKNSNQLPPFKNMLKLFVDGLKFALVSFIYFLPLIIFGILNFMLPHPSLNNMNIAFLMIFLGLIFFVVTVIILPFYFMAIANMAREDKIAYAFKFRSILRTITRSGFGSFIVWFIASGIISIILLSIGDLITNIFDSFNLAIIGSFMYELVLAYANTFLFRSIALAYMSGGKDILECGKCGGYYELMDGESLEDFEMCSCGGELKQVHKFD